MCETQELEVGNDLEMVIIKIFAEGEVAKEIESIKVPIRDIVEDHFLSESGFSIKSPQHQRRANHLMSSPESA